MLNLTNLLVKPIEYKAKIATGLVSVGLSLAAAYGTHEIACVNEHLPTTDYADIANIAKVVEEPIKQDHSSEFLSIKKQLARYF